MQLCEVKRCKRDGGIRYLGYEVCEYHFRKFCKDRKPDLKDPKTYKRREKVNDLINPTEGNPNHGRRAGKQARMPF